MNRNHPSRWNPASSPLLVTPQVGHDWTDPDGAHIVSLDVTDSGYFTSVSECLAFADAAQVAARVLRRRELAAHRQAVTA